MTIAAIHQPQYLPYLGFFHKLMQCDIFIAMDQVEFLRRGIQHRNQVKSKDGAQWLTVPVFHHQKQRINEVVIDSELAWQRKHWQTLKTNYSRAPYFDLYAPDLQTIFDQEWHKLCDLNMRLTQWVMDVLEIKKPIVYMSNLEAEGSKSDLLINLCQAVGAKTYLSGSGGRNYMDLELFESAGIQVLWQTFEPPVYEQRFADVGFLPNLSILDVLFCCGSQTRQFLS